MVEPAIYKKLPLLNEMKSSGVTFLTQRPFVAEDFDSKIIIFDSTGPQVAVFR
jgi:hypothetical protein